MDVDGCERSIRSSKSKLHIDTVSRSFKYNENIAVQIRAEQSPCRTRMGRGEEAVKKPAVQKCCDSMNVVISALMAVIFHHISSYFIIFHHISSYFSPLFLEVQLTLHVTCVCTDRVHRCRQKGNKIHWLICSRYLLTSATSYQYIDVCRSGKSVFTRFGAQLLICMLCIFQRVPVDEFEFVCGLYSKYFKVFHRVAVDGSGARASRASSVAAAACDGPHATPARLGATLRLRSATVALQRSALQRTAASGDRGLAASHCTADCTPWLTQWFCWSLSLLNGYFIGKINPTFSDKPIFHSQDMSLTWHAGCVSRRQEMKLLGTGTRGNRCTSYLLGLGDGLRLQQNFTVFDIFWS